MNLDQLVKHIESTIFNRHGWRVTVMFMCGADRLQTNEKKLEAGKTVIYFFSPIKYRFWNFFQITTLFVYEEMDTIKK